MNELRHSMRINHVLFQPQTRCKHMCLPLLEVEVLAGEENMGKQSSHGEEYTFEHHSQRLAPSLDRTYRKEPGENIFGHGMTWNDME